MLTRGQAQAFTGAWPSLGERRTGAAYADAAYMQLFKGREIKGMVMEKNGIEIENLNLGKI